MSELTRPLAMASASMFEGLEPYNRWSNLIGGASWFFAMVVYALFPALCADYVHRFDSIKMSLSVWSRARSISERSRSA